VYRDVAARHPHAILVDGPAEFHARGNHGLVGDEFFTDGLHPSLNGYTVLAQEILTKLREQRVFGGSAEAPLLNLTPGDCAQRFQMDFTKWSEVCGYSAWFYGLTAYLRYDPAERIAKIAGYANAAQELTDGKPLVSIRIPGVGPWADDSQTLAK
jgi:hypothetical protein